MSTLSSPYIGKRLVLLIYNHIWCTWIWNGLKLWTLARHRLMSVINLYMHLPRNCSCTSWKYFLIYFPLFGQIHIEQCLLVIHGKMIKGSGLLEILSENKFSMVELSAVVDVNNIKRARLLSVHFSTNFVRLCSII